MSNFHTRKHLVRSLYEGVAFSHRYHLEKLLKTRTEPPKSIRLAGGAARSAVWTQMFADVMKLPVECVDVEETGTFGCAVLGAIATGVYPDAETAVGKMGRIDPGCTADPAATVIYDEKYALYCKTIEALDGLWDSMQAYRDKHQ